MAAPRQTRRHPVEVRALILQAAAGLFEEKGYASTTTRQLASAAGVSESVLYSHFPSKGELFRETMLAPLVSFLEAFAANSRRYFAHPLPDRAMVQLFVRELYEELHTHRNSLRFLLTAENELTPVISAQVHDALDALLADVGRVVAEEGKLRGSTPSGPDWETTFRSIFGLVLSAAIFDDWIYSPRNPLAREDLINHLTDLIHQGYARRD